MLPVMLLDVIFIASCMSPRTFSNTPRVFIGTFVACGTTEAVGLIQLSSICFSFDGNLWNNSSDDICADSTDDITL